MIARHGLSDKTVAQIGNVLARFPEVEEAVLFGSRAKGTHKLGSDIDLALAPSTTYRYPTASVSSSSVNGQMAKSQRTSGESAFRYSRQRPSRIRR